MLTKKQIYETAYRQSAIDLNCDPADFKAGKHRLVISKPNSKARVYLELPFYFQLVSYGTNVVASVSEEFRDEAESYVNSYILAHCFETPNMHIINQKLEQRGYNICFMAEYFLPDPDRLKPLCCPYEMRTLYPADFEGLYTDEWSNALCEKRRHLDMLGVGAYDKGKLIGLAGCSADCDTMWQIGIDVLPEYRRQGIASALTSRLALEIFERDKVPFYCTAWSNISSARNAIRSGFDPAWVEMTARPIDFTKKMNELR